MQQEKPRIRVRAFRFLIQISKFDIRTGKNLPKAIRRVYIRILLFYIGGTLIIGLLVPSDDPGLNLTSENAAASPFVIAYVMLILPHRLFIHSYTFVRTPSPAAFREPELRVFPPLSTLVCLLLPGRRRPVISSLAPAHFVCYFLSRPLIRDVYDL